MQKEIETRFLDVNKEDLVKKLLALGAEDRGEETLNEAIFYAADGSWTPPKANKFVRLRQKNGKIKLTYKTNDALQTDSAREIEFEVSDLEKCKEFLLVVGFKAVRRNEKKRHTFALGEVTVDIDTMPRLPTIAEIEGPSIEALKAATNKLGLRWEDRFDGDIRKAYQHYGHDFDKLSVITFADFR